MTGSHAAKVKTKRINRDQLERAYDYMQSSRIGGGQLGDHIKRLLEKDGPLIDPAEVIDFSRSAFYRISQNLRTEHDIRNVKESAVHLELMIDALEKSGAIAPAQKVRGR